MSGKLIFVAGLATGYVLGSRAGRARYEQIKKNWLKVWETDAVQEKVELVEDFAKSRASDLPKTLFAGVKKVTNAINGEGTTGRKSGGPGTSSTSTSTTTDASSYTPPIPGQTGTSTSSTTN
ncbi:YtxH domain-containing protein [Mycetocola sp.]|uniref:YtxH domain-containing protein n=1 Tax=Mycetocola sp. TaxID=1871042 RepID=UPI00398931D6